MSASHAQQRLTHPEADRNAPPSPHLNTSPRPPAFRNDSSTERRRRMAYNQARHIASHSSSPSRSAAFDSTQHTAHRRLSYSPYQPRRSTSEMTESLPAVPNWQPDEEVSKCPVCGEDFSLFFRKHHCRKCGKVVCGECSRHRITLPSRYIVQPPWSADSASLDSTTGGESVRVCNPCVPDPWTPLPAATPDNDNISRPPVNHRYSMPSPPSALSSHNHLHYPSQHVHRRSTDAPQRSNRHSVHFFTTPLSQFYQSQSHPSTSSPQPHRHSATPDILQRRNHPLPPRPDQEAPTSSSPQSIQPTPRPPPRRIVKEEDECPVCGIELAPGAELRAQHITSCIANRFGSLSPTRSTPTAAVGTPVGQPDASSGTPPDLIRARAQSYRSRGLYPYKATEKDCTDNEGQEQECPICFEEFQPGDALGRLECLCRFHHSCIREWWARKGPGMCPVHASHD